MSTEPGKAWTSPIAQDLPSFDPALSVFINCPYEESYRSLRDALIFCIVACGLQPRMAMESDAVDVPRMDRIAHALFTSDYSIHDLSRFQGEGERILSRFNMPLELGMALGRRYASSILGRASRAAAQAGSYVARNHRWLVLVLEGSPVDRFVSDLKAFDPMDYDGRVETIVPRALKWLARLPSATAAPTPGQILQRLETLRVELDVLELEWAGQASWDDVVALARARAKEIVG